MAAQRTSLLIEPRAEHGSRAARRLRRTGYVPGIVYGTGAESVSFKVEARRLRAVLAEGHALFDIQLDGEEPQPVVVKEQQRDAVKGLFVHVDLLKVRLDETIQSMVPLELEGVEDAPGVKEGGVLEHVTREVLIESLPTDIPDRIVADVSGLGIADTLSLSSVSTPSGVTFVGDVAEIVVATVGAPSEVLEEPELEEEAELVGEKAELTPEQAAEAEGETPSGEKPGPPAEGG
jgi:large subunit ribosomal protein L25